MQQKWIAGALDADAHAQFRMARDNRRDRLDELVDGRRCGRRRLTGGTAAQLITARELFESVIQSASHLIVLS
ncbi:hypothetical protein Abr02nite_38910 [Paractinoplanes brasiliensis]|nr:hypothetical protein Abr02nite_38910 [Actinoplanes brasiliensis]